MLIISQKNSSWLLATGGWRLAVDFWISTYNYKWAGTGKTDN